MGPAGDSEVLELTPGQRCDDDLIVSATLEPLNARIGSGSGPELHIFEGHAHKIWLMTDRDFMALPWFQEKPEQIDLGAKWRCRRPCADAAGLVDWFVVECIATLVHEPVLAYWQIFIKTDLEDVLEGGQ